VFLAIALTGVIGIARHPDVLFAMNPYHGLAFFARNHGLGFLVLGSVVLVITGGEALYADMGHFGRRPIRVAWFTVAMPALLMNYFGQGALLLDEPAAVAQTIVRVDGSQRATGDGIFRPTPESRRGARGAGSDIEANCEPTTR
jgi:K+ transporter